MFGGFQGIQLHPPWLSRPIGAWIGAITEENLQFLTDQLEEESREDQDYYLHESTLDLLEENGADKALISLLRGALSGRTEMEVRWSRS